MSDYRQISWAATGLLTDVATLLDFDRRGWITAVEKEGALFLSAAERYRARYILHLRRKKCLSDEQIELVLSVQQPPYSTAEVDEILREHAPDSSPLETVHPVQIGGK